MILVGDVSGTCRRLAAFRRAFEEKPPHSGLIALAALTESSA